MIQASKARNRKAREGKKKEILAEGRRYNGWDGFQLLTNESGLETFHLHSTYILAYLHTIYIYTR